MRLSVWMMAILVAALGARSSLALDPVIAGGVGGIGGRANVSAGWGRSTDDGLAHPGFPSRTNAGQIGVTPGGVTGGTNRGTEDGFHSASTGKIVTAGIGRSTMDSVPGRSPTYIHVVMGTRAATQMGGRGP